MAGFALIEALIAFAIVSIALGTLLSGIGIALRADRHAATRRVALRVAQARLERLGISEALTEGWSEGLDDEGLAWRQNVTPVAPQVEGGSSASAPVPVTAYWAQVSVVVDDGSDISLGAVKLVPTRPRPRT